MSKDAVNSMVMAYERAAGFLEKFVEVSTEKSWDAVIGADPAWQHALHAFATCEFFLAPKEGGTGPAHHFPGEVVMFGTRPAAPAKDKLKTVARETREYSLKILNALNDDDLGKIHEGASARLGAPMTNAGVIANYIGHLYYHFGHCDAALLSNGETGLF